MRILRAQQEKAFAIRDQGRFSGLRLCPAPRPHEWAVVICHSPTEVPKSDPSLAVTDSGADRIAEVASSVDATSCTHMLVWWPSWLRLALSCARAESGCGGQDEIAPTKCDIDSNPQRQRRCRAKREKCSAGLGRHHGAESDILRRHCSC